MQDARETAGRTPQAAARPAGAGRLEPGLAAEFARVALANISRPYPRKLDHLLLGPEPAGWDPRVRHPVFYGSYDWHSAVHMHWLLVRVLRRFPRGERAAEIGDRLARRLTPERLDAERAHLASPSGRVFERPYGWAWVLELRAELERLRADDSRAAGWAGALAPLAGDLAARLAGFLRSAAYPQRAGTHGNTAFAGLLALDYARVCGDAPLRRALEEAASRWHGGDRGARPDFEPSLTDFLSPILVEAAWMAALLPGGSFGEWFDGLLPGGIGRLAEPPVAGDRSDPQMVHLDGLSLSRAWCLRRIAAALPAGHPRRAEALAGAAANLEAGLPRAVGGDYAGEHWLATFAALALGDEP